MENILASGVSIYPHLDGQKEIFLLSTSHKYQFIDFSLPEASREMGHCECVKKDKIKTEDGQVDQW